MKPSVPQSPYSPPAGESKRSFSVSVGGELRATAPPPNPQTDLAQYCFAIASLRVRRKAGMTNGAEAIA